MELSPIWESRQMRSYSTISQHFMEPEHLLPHSQEYSIGPSPEPGHSNPYNSILSL
jgi:hypothetical protein